MQHPRGLTAAGHLDSLPSIVQTLSIHSVASLPRRPDSAGRSNRVRIIPFVVVRSDGFCDRSADMLRR